MKLSRYRIRPTLAGYVIEERVFLIFWVQAWTSYDKPLTFSTIQAARAWCQNPTPV